MRERLGKIRLLLLDVDGVMTDGRIVYDDHGNETKAFDVKDGHGLKLLQRAGIRVGIITGRQSPVVDRRAAERVQHHIHALPAGGGVELAGKAEAARVGDVGDALRPEEGALGLTAGGGKHFGPGALSDLHRCQPGAGGG